MKQKAPELSWADVMQAPGLRVAKGACSMLLPPSTVYIIHTSGACLRQELCVRRLQRTERKTWRWLKREGRIWRRRSPCRTAPATPALNSPLAIDDDDDDVHQTIARIALALVADYL